MHNKKKKDFFLNASFLYGKAALLILSWTFLLSLVPCNIAGNFFIATL